MPTKLLITTMPDQFTVHFNRTACEGVMLHICMDVDGDGDPVSTLVLAVLTPQNFSDDHTVGSILEANESSCVFP